MFIIPLPWDINNLQELRDIDDVFDLVMNDSTQQYYLVVQDNTITWIGQGTVPGKMAYQIKSRSVTMNEKRGLPKNHGNVGFMGKYSGIEDAVLKLFPKEGYCASKMRFSPYTGQKLKGVKNHYNVIHPILCLMGDHPSSDLQRFFKALGWGGRRRFDCTGTWGDMKLLIEDQATPSLETWFTDYCSIALEEKIGR